MARIVVKGKRYVTSCSGCRGCAFEHSNEEDKITDEESDSFCRNKYVCELCSGSEIFVLKEDADA